MNYRNKKLLQSAKFESCVSCGAPDSAWCHSDEMAHGQGKGIKSHDLFGFYGCMHCHDWYDGRSKTAPPSFTENMDYINKQEWFMAMWEASMLIVCEKGYL